MIMRFKQRVLAEVQFDCFRRIKQRAHHSIGGKGFQRIAKPGRQVRTDPEHKVGILQCRRFGRAQAVFMRTGPWLYDEVGRADPLHHPRDERVNRRNISSNLRRIGKGGCACQRDCQGKGETHSGHSKYHVII